MLSNFYRNFVGYIINLKMIWVKINKSLSAVCGNLMIGEKNSYDLAKVIDFCAPLEYNFIHPK